jgi:thiamine-phosphate pyrophosphorylase
VGIEYLEFVAKNINIPFVAIGGIKEYNIKQIIKTGAKSIALVTEITEAQNIAEKIKDLNRMMF